MGTAQSNQIIKRQSMKDDSSLVFYKRENSNM